MTPELLAVILAFILSLFASYLPGFSTWYDALETTAKRLVMASGLLLITLTVGGIACAGYGVQIGVTLTCDVAGFWILLKAFLASLAVNQATYQLTKPSTTEQIYAAAKIIQARKPTGAKK